jgi:hypothetical protein
MTRDELSDTHYPRHTIKRLLAKSWLGQWMLNRALALHMKDPRRFEFGPDRCNVWGWIYFTFLCGIST